MAEINETPESQEKPGGDIGAEQKVEAEQPVDVQPAGPSKEVNKDARIWAMFCHLGGLVGLPLPIVGNIVTPLVVWQIKKDDFPFVDEQGKEALNFQISMSLYGLIGVVACLITCVGAVLIPFLLAAVYIIDFIFLLIAAVKANNGYHYRYPLTIRFIK
jgi:hypothetical protein